MSDMLTDMGRKPRKATEKKAAKVFTVRDVNRQTAKVLATCDRHGAVSIISRDGRSYELKAKESSLAQLPDFDALWELQRQAGCLPPGPQDEARINRMIAGEE